MKKFIDSQIYWPFVFVIIALCLISCITLKLAVPYFTVVGASGIWNKQLIFYILGIVIIYMIIKFGNDHIYAGMWILYGILIAFLVGLVIERFATIKLGISIVPLAKSTNGATSWYKFGFFDFQPSEFMKIVMIICMAKTISLHNETYPVHDFENDLKLIGKIAAISLPPMILTYLQNDAGVTLIMAASVVFILFASGIQKGWYIFGVSALILIIAILCYLFIFQPEIFSKIITGHKLDRIYGWLDPEGTYKNEGFQLFNAMMAYGTAGLFGHGFDNVIISLQEAQTDFIFSVITLGFGFAGAFVTLLLIFGLDFCVLNIGLKATHQSDRYFVSGVFGCLIFQQFWNIAMILGILPITGITLPLLSYGGSSLLSYMIAIGMCFDIHRQTTIARHNAAD